MRRDSVGLLNTVIECIIERCTSAVCPTNVSDEEVGPERESEREREVSGHLFTVPSKLPLNKSPLHEKFRKFVKKNRTCPNPLNQNKVK